MKQGLSIVAKLAIAVMTLAVISICGILLPELAREEASPQAISSQTYVMLASAWVLAIPIFVALFQAYKLIARIDNGLAFSEGSIKSLTMIKLCALLFGGFILVAAATVIILAKQADPSEDVTPVATIGAVLIFVSAIIAAFIAVLQKLLQNAIDIKEQNDLTV